MCDGGQDYIDKQYSFIAHLSDVTVTLMRKGGKERQKEGGKRIEDVEYTQRSTNMKLNQMNTDSNCASTSQ